MGTEAGASQKVTCRKCGATYVPNFVRDFYPDGEDPKVGLCESCMMSEAFGVSTKQPHPLPNGYLDTVCNAGKGAATCSFLVMGSGFQCAKDSVFERNLRQRLAEGTMEAKGNNCSGPPDFTPISS